MLDACNMFWPGSTVCYNNKASPAQDGWSCNVGKGCPGNTFGDGFTLGRYCQLLGYKTSRPAPPNFAADGWYCVDSSNRPVGPCAGLKDCSSCMHGASGCYWCATDNTCRAANDKTCAKPVKSAACCNGAVSGCCSKASYPSCSSYSGCPDCSKVTNDDGCCITSATGSDDSTCPTGFSPQGTAYGDDDWCWDTWTFTRWKYKCRRNC